MYKKEKQEDYLVEALYNLPIFYAYRLKWILDPFKIPAKYNKN